MSQTQWEQTRLALRVRDAGSLHFLTICATPVLASARRTATSLLPSARCRVACGVLGRLGVAQRSKPDSLENRAKLLAATA